MFFVFMLLYTDELRFINQAIRLSLFSVAL